MLNTAKETIIDKCLSLADTALENNWTYHYANEALFWFHHVLQIDHHHAKARLGAAKACQYIVSQPWWHNDLSLARGAAGKALAAVDAPFGPRDANEQDLAKGQIYSAIGQPHLAEKHFTNALSRDSKYSPTNYFIN